MPRARAPTPKPKRQSTQPTRPLPPAPRRVPQPLLPATTWRMHVLPLATLAVLPLVLYLPCVRGAFVFDDPNAVSQSTLVHSLLPLDRFLTLSTRPLTDFSLAVNYAMGGLATPPYHLTNILLHVGNVLLLYGIGWATFATLPLAHRYGPARRVLAWTAAALFAVHPLASEGVAYVSSRSEVLVAGWILLALGCFIVASTTRRQRLRRGAAVLLPAATAAGLASKEIAVTIPFALLLYDWLFLAERSWQRTRPRRWLVGLSFAPLVLGGTFLLVRAYVSPSPMGDYGSTAGFSFDRFTRWEYLMTQFGAIVHYLRLAILPVGLTFDYDWPLARTPLALGVVLPFALLVALVVAAVRLAPTQPLVTFTVGWTLLLLAPTSSVLPIADLVVERRMYLPLAGLMLLAAAWLWDLVQRLPATWRAQPAWTYAALVVVPLVASGGLTYQRAVLWGDAIALHEDGVAKAPGNPRVRLNLAATYLNAGDQQRAYETLLTAKALYERQQSIQAFPRIGAFIQYNLGAVLFARQEFERAEKELQRAIELGGQYLAIRPMAYMLLSRIAAQREDWQTAATDMQEAVTYRPDMVDWRIDLAQMKRHAGDRMGAAVMLRQTMQSFPDNQRAAAVWNRWQEEDTRPAEAAP